MKVPVALVHAKALVPASLHNQGCSREPGLRVLIQVDYKQLPFCSPFPRTGDPLHKFSGEHL